MISVNVKLFAMVRDIVGAGDFLMSLQERSSASALVSALGMKYPELEKWRHHLRIAVNGEYVDEHHVLKDADEVALIPPVSGG